MAIKNMTTLIDAIPSDYSGVMGVPISFLGKYCPEQFEILDLLNRYTIMDSQQTNTFVQQNHLHTCSVNGDIKFSRIAIRKKSSV